MPDETASAVANPEIEKERGRGHIGLVVLGSITGGLILGLTLTLGVFGAGRENVITGAALIALAFGMLMLVALARWRTDSPQSWAFVPALGIGVVGLALHPRAGDRVPAGWDGSGRFFLPRCRQAARCAARCTTGRVEASLSGVRRLGAIALGGVYETVTEATTDNNPPLGAAPTSSRAHLYLRCTGSGSPAVVLFNGPGNGLPAGLVQGCRARDEGLRLRSRRQGWAERRVARTRISFPPTCVAFLRQRLFPAHTFSPVTRQQYALPAMDYPKDIAGVALIDSSTPYQFDRHVLALLLAVASWVGATSDPRTGRCRTCLLAQRL
jgi:hypothetical protein